MFLLLIGYTVQHPAKDTSLDETELSNNLPNNDLPENLPTPDPVKVMKNPKSKF